MREAKIVECKFIDGTDDDMRCHLIENGEAELYFYLVRVYTMQKMRIKGIINL